jgi:hypothetical protein
VVVTTVVVVVTTIVVTTIVVVTTTIVVTTSSWPMPYCPAGAVRYRTDMSSHLPTTDPLAGPKPAVWSTGAVALALGVPQWCVRRVVQRRMVPSVVRLREGGYCVWTDANVGELVAALKAAGYLDPAAPVPSLTVVDHTAEVLARLAGTKHTAPPPQRRRSNADES